MYLKIQNTLAATQKLLDVAVILSDQVNGTSNGIHRAYRILNKLSKGGIIF